jgi:hypothetical protein
VDHAPSQSENARPPVHGILLDIALNAIVPLILYRLSKCYISPSELTALCISAVFPLAKSVSDMLRPRQTDPIAVVVLLGIGASGFAIPLGGSQQSLQNQSHKS